MFFVKLIAFLCILVQANAYQRNEGSEYGWMTAFNDASSSQDGSQVMDFLSRMVLGHSVSELKAKFNKKNFDGLFENNVAWEEYQNRFLGRTDAPKDERHFASRITTIVAELVIGGINTSEALTQLDEEWKKMSTNARAEWIKDMRKLSTDHAEGKIKNNK